MQWYWWVLISLGVIVFGIWIYVGYVYGWFSRVRMPRLSTTPLKRIWSGSLGVRKGLGTLLRKGGSGFVKGPKKVLSLLKWTGSNLKKVTVPRPHLDNIHSIYFIAHLVIFSLAVFAWLTGKSGGVGWPLVSITLAICHGVTAFRVIGEQENGVLVLLGRIIRATPTRRHFVSGPMFAPWPSKLVLFSKHEVTTHFGTALDPETIRKAEKYEPSRALFVDVEPMRTNWGRAEKAEDKKLFENSPLAEEMTTDPHLYATILISDPATYLEVVGRSVEEGLERIIANSTRVMQTIAGGTFIGKAQKEKAKIEKLLLRSIEDLVGDPQAVARGTSKRAPWGVDVTEAGIKGFGLPRTVAEAQRTRAAAIATADGQATAAIRTSQGNKKATENAALAELFSRKKAAEALEREGDAEAHVLSAKAAVAETRGGEIILRNNAVLEGLKSGKVVFMPNTGLADVVGAVMSAKVALDSLPATPPPPPAPAPAPPTTP